MDKGLHFFRYLKSPDMGNGSITFLFCRNYISRIGISHSRLRHLFHPRLSPLLTGQLYKLGFYVNMLKPDQRVCD